MIMYFKIQYAIVPYKNLREYVDVCWDEKVPTKAKNTFPLVTIHTILFISIIKLNDVVVGLHFIKIAQERKLKKNYSKVCYKYIIHFRKFVGIIS